MSSGRAAIIETLLPAYLAESSEPVVRSIWAAMLALSGDAFVANERLAQAFLAAADYCGSDAGTVRVKDIRPGAAGSTPLMIRNVAGKATFPANDAVHGFEIWSSDGTDAGTLLVKDMVAGAGSPSIDNLTSFGGSLYFTATDAASGPCFWRKI